jgi:hypothetical protein
MSDFRQLTAYEEEVLRTLLSRPFPGREELLLQLPHVKARVITGYNDNYGSIEFTHPYRGLSSSNVTRRVPVEGRAYDADGVSIGHLLHIVNGKLHELEVLRVDGKPIQVRPDPEDLDLFVH